MVFADFTNLISVLTPIILAVMGFLFNHRLNKEKKQAIKKEEIRVEKEKEEKEAREKKNKEQEERIKTFIFDKLESVEVKLTDLEISVNAHIEETDFKTEFKDSIRHKSRQILIHLTDFLSLEQKNILGYWADVIEGFGLDFFYTSKRKGRKKKLDTYLSQELELHIGNFHNYIDSIYEEIRIYNKKNYFFSQFIDEVKLHSRSDQLKMRCVANGFKDNVEIIEEFVGYIEDFFSDFTSAIRVWNLLEVYEKEIAA